ncbi:MAG: type II toxin-antitoxin system HicA family toxin [Acidobacteria bacterium]|nr:type II toxin-antitoxin system HicA family toxin [Acidobacteriota bacterium]
MPTSTLLKPTSCPYLKNTSTHASLPCDPPVVSGRACVRVLERVGFHVIRQVGSHIVLRRDEPFCQVVVPDHRTLDRGTLRSILPPAGLTPKQFRDLL